MKYKSKPIEAFTLVEMLVMIAIIAIFAALLLPALNRAKAKAQWTACMNNLRQINLGIRMYSDDSHDDSPSPGSAASPTNFPALYSGYKQLIKNYVGANGASSPHNKLFACPADKFYPNHIFGPDDLVPSTAYVQKGLHEEPYVDFSSYSFNGGDGRTEAVGTNGATIIRIGLGNVKLSAVKHPSRTVLIAEASALAPWSWHQPSAQFIFNNAMNMVSFVDGHVSYLKIFKKSNGALAIFYNPPDGYDYQWTPD